jgi:hypothetical protein
MSTEAPSAAELEANPVVRDAIEAAWVDSLHDDPALRHEEGGWVYRDPTTNQTTVVRARPGRQAAIDLNNPPEIVGAVVVGKFHTHPNPTAEGWDPGPSAGDTMVDAIHGVPDLIRADDGIYYSGPDRRRGGMTGNPGYPA